jgi:hypothetical protein
MPPKTPAERAAERKAKEAAEAAAKAAAAAAAAVAAAPCPAPTPEEIEKKRIDDAYDELAKNGHAVQRHGEAITQQQLEDRAVKGFDPVTGSTDDGYHKNADGTPKKHLSGRDATKFASKEAMVKAAEAVKKNPDYKKELEAAEKAGSSRFSVETTKLEDALGKDYKKQVAGVTRLGSKNHPTGSQPTDFTDGSVTAVFEKDAKGNWNTLTMYPNPA